ncbi:thiol peroxidase [bacterium]|nr:thiol peroxidase [bacterium]
MITFKGEPITLEGTPVKEGDQAPDFFALNHDFEHVRLSDFKGQVVIISAVPSVDTTVCAAQTRRFNIEAARHGIKTLTISMDLPFAQSRFCTTEKINHATLLSDFRDRDFATKFGLRIEGMGLITRAVYVIDKTGRIAYRQICADLGQEPNYEEAIQAARKANA